MNKHQNTFLNSEHSNVRYLHSISSQCQGEIISDSSRIFRPRRNLLLQCNGVDVSVMKKKRFNRVNIIVALSSLLIENKRQRNREVEYGEPLGSQIIWQNFDGITVYLIIFLKKSMLNRSAHSRNNQRRICKLKIEISDKPARLSTDVSLTASIN